VAAFRSDLVEFQQDITATTSVLKQSTGKVQAMQMALSRISVLSGDLYAQLYQVEKSLADLQVQLNGDPIKDEVGELSEQSPRSMMYVGYRGLRGTYGPTETHRESLLVGVEKLSEIKSELAKISEVEIPALEKALKNAGAPWIEGQGLISN
jgi:hypothetical protein